MCIVFWHANPSWLQLSIYKTIALLCRFTRAGLLCAHMHVTATIRAAKHKTTRTHSFTHSLRLYFLQCGFWTPVRKENTQSSSVCPRLDFFFPNHKGFSGRRIGGGIRTGVSRGLQHTTSGLYKETAVENSRTRDGGETTAKGL